MGLCLTTKQFNILTNQIRLGLVGPSLVSKPTLAIGSTATHVSNAVFDYIIDGIRRTEAILAAGTAPGNDVVLTGQYGAVALDIGANGTVDVIEAAGNADPSYDSAALALAGLATPLPGHVRMGTVVVTKSDGAFTFGTTDLDAANVTTVYADGNCIGEDLNAAAEYA